MNIGQIRAFIAVYEEGAFSRAAARGGATQSGLSMQIRNLEQRLAVRLFERTTQGVEPTIAGQRYYADVAPLVNALQAAEQGINAMAGEPSGELRVGLMPGTTRHGIGALLAKFTARYANVDLRIFEAFSGALTDEVVADALDFAIVPQLTAPTGMDARLLARDHEVLVSGPALGLAALAPVRLTELAPLKLCLPGPQNSRRKTLDEYISVEGVAVERIMELDTINATIELVAHSSWATILPLASCISEVRAGGSGINPIVGPPIASSYMLIQPSRRPLGTAAALLADALEIELVERTSVWHEILTPAEAA